MNGYIQKDVRGKLNKLIAYEGLNELGYYTQIVEGPLIDDPEGIYYGNVNWIDGTAAGLGYDVFRKLGEVPESLRPFAGREIKLTSLSKAITQHGKFIKPVAKFQKQFDGFVNRVEMDKLNVGHLLSGDMGDSVEVWVSDYIPIISEWRCFILDGECVAAEHYKGSFRKAPNFDVVDAMIKEYKGHQIAYGLDVYIDPNGQTHLMELNDVMSLGSYGCLPNVIARMLDARWEQIHKQRKL